MTYSWNRVGRVVAGTYLLLVFIVCTPLIQDLAIHHGNGIAFLAAVVLTSPLSWLLLWIVDQLASPNAFEPSVRNFVVGMGILISCALTNARVIVYLFSRKWGSMK